MSTELESSNEGHAIPQAPPLPSFQGVRNAAYRIIGLPSRPPSPKLAKVDLTLPAFNRFAALGAGQNATSSHRTGLEIKTLSINDRGTHALIGGKEIFKTVKVENGVCVEDRNLRTAIRSTPTQASGHVRQIYSIDIADVAWAKGDCGDYIAAATSSGKIILYDLGHAALQAALLHEHYRQVHKVTFNPHRGSLLLSGSQDGTVRLWDVRDVRTHASTMQSKRKFSGQSDGVRDVKWSPTEGVDFAFGTDSGWIQRWDIRNLKVPKIRIPAHHSSCTSLDWHADGKHLVSAGMDKTLRVWDFAGTRVHKPTWEVRTPYPVSNARWRPACESSLPHDNGARMCTQIVTAYDSAHPVVHIWDLRRPALPFRFLTPYVTAPTDLLWHSQDLLWTVGREGIFQQTDVQHTTKLIDQRNLQAVAYAANGRTTFAVQQRHSRTKPRHYSLPKLQTPGSSLSQSPESLNLSRSWADDSLDHSFLSVQLARRPSQIKFVSKSSRVMSTPPSISGKQAVLKLDDILRNRQSFTPPQSAFSGSLSIQLSKETVASIEEAYMHALSHSSSDKDLPQLIEHMLERYAEAADKAQQFRLAQMWRITGFAATGLLRRRLEESANATRKKREHSHAGGRLYELEHMIEDVVDKLSSPKASSYNSPASMRPINTIAQALATTESTSNVPTPLAKAVSHESSQQLTHGGSALLNVETGTDLDPLPPSLTGHQRPARPSSHANGQPEVRQQVSPWIISNGYDQSTQQPQTRPRLHKHDSDESFVFMVGSQSSRAESPGSLSAVDSPASMVKSRPSRPVLKINPATPLSSEIRAVLSESQRSEIDLSPSLPIIFPADYESDIEPTTSMQGSRELPRQAVLEHDDITALKASVKYEDDPEEPFTILEMLRELAAYYTTVLPNSQTASYLLLSLIPLLPKTAPLESNTAKLCLSSYGESMLAAGFAIEDVSAILTQTLRHLIMAGINPLQLESVLAAHHTELQAWELHAAATNLRKQAYPIFPSVYEHGLDQDDFVLVCGSCKQRLVHDANSSKCDACGTKQMECSICLCEASPFDNRAGGSLKAVCLLCTHSAHVGCASQWFGTTHGRRCPTEGCLCTCTASG